MDVFEAMAELRAMDASGWPLQDGYREAIAAADAGLERMADELARLREQRDWARKERHEEQIAAQTARDQVTACEGIMARLRAEVGRLRRERDAEERRLEWLMVNTHAAGEIPGSEEWADDVEFAEGDEGEDATELRFGQTWFEFLRDRIDEQVRAAGLDAGPPADGEEWFGCEDCGNSRPASRLSVRRVCSSCADALAKSRRDVSVLMDLLRRFGWPDVKPPAAGLDAGDATKGTATHGEGEGR